MSKKTPPLAEDILSFARMLDRRKEVFLQRREKYGNHLDNSKRFPLEHAHAMYIKCARVIRMIERGEELDNDTLLDIGNYADIMLSCRDHNSEEDV